jgi:serine/threonine protein kinase
MTYLHTKGIVHRDLSARNLLVDSFNTVKVSDFGLAKNFESGADVSTLNEEEQIAVKKKNFLTVEGLVECTRSVNCRKIL